MSGRSDDSPPPVPPSLAFATSTPRGAGEVPVLVAGVRDRQHLNQLIAVIERIPSVRGVAIAGYERPDAPLLTVSVSRSMPLAGEIRTRIGPTVASSALVDGRVEVVLSDSATVSGRPRAPRSAPLSRTAPRRPGAGPTRPSTASGPSRPDAGGGPPGSGPGSSGPASGGTARPWEQPRSGPAWAASPFPPFSGTAARAQPAAGPTVPPPVEDPAAAAAADAASTLDAFVAEGDLSILIWDAGLTVRAAYGGLHDRSPRLRGGPVGRHIDDVLPPDPYVGLADLVRGALAGTAGELEVTSATSDRHYRITVKPVHEGPRIVGCMSVSRDISRQRDDARLIGELTDVFETSFDRSPSGQALLSPTGQWLRVNDALRRLLGRGDEQLLGSSLREVTHPDDTAREQGLLREVLAGNADGYEIDKRFVHGGGEPVRAFVRMSPIRAADGAVRGFIAHVVDADRWEPAPAD